jgi:hypothetical protein
MSHVYLGCETKMREEVETLDSVLLNMQQSCLENGILLEWEYKVGSFEI